MFIIGIVMSTMPILYFVMLPFEPQISMHFILSAIFTNLILYITTEKQTGLILKRTPTVVKQTKIWGRMAKRRRFLRPTDILRPTYLWMESWVDGTYGELESIYIDSWYWLFLKYVTAIVSPIVAIRFELFSSQISRFDNLSSVTVISIMNSHFLSMICL